MTDRKAGRWIIAAGTAFAAVLLWVVGAAFDDARDDAQRDAVVNGAYLSWMVAGECERGRAQCDAALRKANANDYGVWFSADGSAAPKGDVKW